MNGLEHQVFPSWVQDTDGTWNPPLTKPTDGEYIWNEITRSWVNPHTIDRLLASDGNYYVLRFDTETETNIWIKE